MQLTTKETTVLTAAIEVNTTIASAEEDDFFSFFYPYEVQASTGMKMEAVAALLGSLESKGMIEEQETNNRDASRTEYSVAWEAVETLRQAR